MTTGNIFTTRKTLDQICSAPDKIISVYSLEQHVWADSNSDKARKERQPELRTIEEFQLDPVRPFLNDIFRNMAAPYKPDRRDNPVGQGYWIQAEFGSGKSHLLCLLAALALGQQKAWDIVRSKENKEGRGRRESLYRFWEEGLQSKSTGGNKGIFVIVKTLVGAGGGVVGQAEKGQRLSEYILDAAKEQIAREIGKNISLYPAELLADWFLKEGVDTYRAPLRKYLRDPRFFEEDEFEDVDDLIRGIQENKSPEYKHSCGEKLWRFFTDYLQVQPKVPAEAEDVLRHLVEAILAEGYAGVLLVLDEVSLFMKDRTEAQRTDDEKTLVVLTNRLTRANSLPIWTVCAAQQAIESKMGVKNIIADDRLKLVPLLDKDQDYYDIVLSRVREIKDEAAIRNYYLYYKRGFTWPATIGEDEFIHFFPFHKPALEVLRYITHELTTARSAIHFMHQTLKHQIKSNGDEVIRLWELFDEAVQYEEDPSGHHAGMVAIKTKCESEYRAYEACKRQIDSFTKGLLKVHSDKATKIVQTLFLYHIARTRQQGLSPEEIANSVLIERSPDATTEENINHYENLAANLRKELPQVAESPDEEGKPRYRFEPVVSGINPRDEFRKARAEAESSPLMGKEAWEHLLALGPWPVRTRQMTIDLSHEVTSIFQDVAPFVGVWETGSARRGDQDLSVRWLGREVTGLVCMRDLNRLDVDRTPLPDLQTDETDRDFAAIIGISPVKQEVVNRLLGQRKDPRVVVWTPGDLTQEEQDRLLDFAAYRRLVSLWGGKETEEASAVITWVYKALETDLGSKIAKIVDNCYARGRMDSLENTQMAYTVAGDLENVLTPVVGRVLEATYESRLVKFDLPVAFTKEDGVKVINGIVKVGSIPKGTKPNKDISAAQNFGAGLLVVKKAADKTLDVSGNPFVTDMLDFIEQKLAGGQQQMKMETLYKNFMGIGSPKSYGFTRRMVQIYLLCLVQQGKVRLGLGTRSGLTTSIIDYANLAGIDFSAKVLDALSEVQLMAKPENWEVLRPYAEKLLGKAVAATHDDAAISACRAELRELFKQGREESQRLQSRATGLFTVLQQENLYATELAQVVKLFGHDVEGTNDIDLILVALKEAFGYQAYDSASVSQAEVDDLAVRLRNYKALLSFVGYDVELRAAQAYSQEDLPGSAIFDEFRRSQQELRGKMASLKPYIDSEVKLKTELIGHLPAEPGERGTLGAIVRDYQTFYLTAHDQAMAASDAARGTILGITGGDSMKALRILEGVTALSPAVCAKLETQLTSLQNALYTCVSPSHIAVATALQRGPTHECGLKLLNVEALVTGAQSAAQQGAALFRNEFEKEMAVFLNQQVRSRLEQDRQHPVIAGLLTCKDVAQIGEYLQKACLNDPDVVDVINRYLRKVVFKTVRMSDFHPSATTIEKGQVEVTAKEFQQFLEAQFDSVGSEGDTVPILKME